LRQPRPVKNAYPAIASSQVQLINILKIEIAAARIAADRCVRLLDFEM
jgi:hypothetical protein